MHWVLGQFLPFVSSLPMGYSKKQNVGDRKNWTHGMMIKPTKQIEQAAPPRDGTACFSVSNHICLSHRKLAVIKIRIKSILRQQRLMGALLNNVPVFHHQDHIRLPDRGKAVRDDKAGPPLHHGRKCFLDADLGPRIDGGGCLIQNQHRRQAQHDPGDA